ncbi:MAG: DUF1841 family protein [Azoarcus sp.]|jgi:hypothetical protein|nr:DUF1841 family protein [Azoarcus sp.]
MFNPTREQVRDFFIGAWRKHRNREVLSALETIAAGIVLEHPEYHDLLESANALAREFPPEDGQTNPFLHLSLHLAIEEQISIDQPPGIRTVFEALCRRYGRHSAMHELLDSLGETMFRAMRDGASPDGSAYIDSARRRAGMPPIRD